LPRRLQALRFLPRLDHDQRALFEKLEALELSLKTRKPMRTHQRARRHRARELKLNTEQLKAVGNDPLKLTMQY
jgi:hypothetical protein